MGRWIGAGCIFEHDEFSNGCFFLCETMGNWVILAAQIIPEDPPHDT